MVLTVSACNMNNNRDLTKGYDNNGLRPYTYGDNYPNNGRNGMLYNRYDNTNRYSTNRYDPLANNTRDYSMNRYNTNNNRLTTNTNDQADKIANIASRVNGVNDATVVIAGRTAYVGLDLNDNVQSNQANSVERKVYNAVKKSANGYNVSITSDNDLFGRLRDIGDGIRSGTPLNNYRNDFRTFDNRFDGF